MVGLGIFLFVVLLTLFLGVTVFVHDPRDRSHRLFLAWIACSVAWMAFNYLENVPALSIEVRTFFLRADFSAAMAAAGFILLFVTSFIGRSVPSRKLAAMALPAAALAALSFTPWLVARVSVAEGGALRFEEGFLFFAYVPVLIAHFLLPIVLLLRARRRAEEPRLRAQAASVAVGLAAFAAVTLTVNLFLQNALSTEAFRVGIYAMLFFVAGVAWAIARHRFLKVRFLAAELLLLGILAALLTRVLLAGSVRQAAFDLASLGVALVLGFVLVRGVLREERHRRELEALAAELSASNARLRRLDDLKTTMVSIASHQIRGPLGGIRGYLTMFRDGDLGPIGPKQKEIVTLNLNVTTRLLNAVETFLDITKLESGSLAVRTEVLPIDAALEDVHGEFVLPAAKKGIALSLKIDGPRPILADFDPEKIKHVIFNLIDNALKYTEEGSVAVTLRREGNEAVVEVADTGMGIPPGDAPRLFGKFQRGELVIDRGGSGLGLYVAKMLTEMQRGRIWASSPGVGRGSTFGFSVPLARDL